MQGQLTSALVCGPAVLSVPQEGILSEHPKVENYSIRLGITLAYQELLVPLTYVPAVDRVTPFADPSAYPLFPSYRA